MPVSHCAVNDTVFHRDRVMTRSVFHSDSVIASQRTLLCILTKPVTLRMHDTVIDRIV